MKTNRGKRKDKDETEKLNRFWMREGCKPAQLSLGVFSMQTTLISSKLFKN